MKYFVENQIQNPKNLLSFQTVPEKSKNSKKMFSGPFSATFGQNLGPYSHQNLWAKIYFLGPLSSYFAEFSAT